MHVRSTATRETELAPCLGGIVVDAGLALIDLEAVRAYPVSLLVASLVVHGAGMTPKYRHEGRESPPVWWERLLLWLC